MIQIEKHSGVGFVWLARPDKHNAFDGDMLEAIDSTFAEWQDDPQLRVIVLGSEGASFCSGADLKWMAQQGKAGPDANRANAVQLGRVFHRIATSKKPVVARVHGAARGGGVGLLAACDITVASTDASFALTEVRLGLVPAVISPFLVERLGPSQARALFLTGDTVSAQDAYRLGLVHHLVAPEALTDRVTSVVRSLLLGGPQAQVACKQLVAAVQYRNPLDMLEFTADLIAQRRASEEATEGMRAFIERRPASWVPHAESAAETVTEPVTAPVPSPDKES